MAGEDRERTLETLRRTWDRLGRDDPLWAVLSEPERRGGRWDVEEFFATGREEVEGLVRRIDELGLTLRRDRCLDFGCGVGRVTQALADHFAQADGVDIAASMVDHARRFNRHGDRCRYHVNEVDDLSLFEDAAFDLVYTRIVLMHMAPEHALRYIGEFLRVLRPGGLAVFHVPSGPSGPPREAYALPPEACRATVVVEETPRVARAGTVATCRVRVRNAGVATWPAGGHLLGFGAVRVGNHWLTARGRRLTDDDGRASLPRDLGPGEEAVVAVAVRAPSRPGLRLLEMDVVQEGFAWFAGRGSPTVRVPVLVLPRAGRAHDGAVSMDDQVPFEMHAVPREDVLAAVQAAGCRLVTTDEVDTGAFHDVHYVVTKPV